MKTYFLPVLLLLLVIAACRQEAPATRSVMARPAPAPAAAADTNKGLPSDGSFGRFMDSLLGQQEIVYATKPVEVREDWYFDEQWGPTAREPERFVIGGRPVLKRGIIPVNGEAERLRNTRYEVDTAEAFRFAGHDYVRFRASFYMCNGTGCLEEFHFLYDVQRRRLHVFDLMAVPGCCRNLFGNLNGDDQLDFLMPDALYTDGDYLSDTTATPISLTPYTLGRDGYFHKLEDQYGQSCYLIGSFTNGLYEPRNFRLIGSGCLGLPPAGGRHALRSTH